MVQGGKYSINFYGTYERGMVIIDGMLYIKLVCFFPTKMMGIIKIHFGHNVAKYTQGMECPHIFCAGVGPLQLSVVLV